MSSPGSRLAFTVAYDGSDFQGWQVQPDGVPTVQETIEEAFAVLCGGERPRIHASGRTDTGVHARGQVFHANPARSGYEPDKWRESLNGLLPASIRILNVRTVPETFHARFDALRKEYRYFLFAGRVLPPDLRAYRLHVRSDLDLSAMQTVASHWVGTHDFTSFSARRGDGEEDPIRTVFTSEVLEQAEGLMFRISANGFLYKMVRRLTGALIEAGQGRLSCDEVLQALCTPSKQSTILTAPPQGLFLWDVHYSEHDED